MRTLGLLVITLALSTTACKKKTADNGGGSGSGSGDGSSMTMGSGSSMATGSGSDMGSGSGSSMATGSGSGGTGSGSGDAAAMAHKAGMCPSTVAGSTTKVDGKDGKLMVTITSDDKDAISAIQKRTEELLKEKADNMGATGKTGSEHDQKGTHGGGMGICPVHVPEGATATAKNDAKGVTVTIALKDPKTMDDAKKDIEGRITKAADWVKSLKEGDKGNTGAVGGGSGKHGMNHTGKGDGKGQERDKAGSGSAK